ncbi:MAG: LysM peptidoglycan-binding domain-containing protein, partial [Clostridiaceae bacterium]|nr:LysM peptidoglycan-binding domain-containing protein [Clostridiaceae bacterium]
KENPASICTDVEIVGEASNADRPSILIYFASKDEDSWDVAKKYNVSVADILRANNLSEGDIIKAGTKLLIPR